MLLAHVAPEVIESSPALALSALVANADASLTETASALDTIPPDHRAAERRAKECRRDGHMGLVLDMFKSTCGGCALGREEIKQRSGGFAVRVLNLSFSSSGGYSTNRGAAQSTRSSSDDSCPSRSGQLALDSNTSGRDHAHAHASPPRIRMNSQRVRVLRHLRVSSLRTRRVTRTIPTGVARNAPLSGHTRVHWTARVL